MSFRNRLTLFFVLIVVVPMVAVAFVLFRLIADNESGKADARLAATKGSAINLYREDFNRANVAAEKIGSDVALSQALRDGDRQALETRLEELLKQERARRIVIANGSRATADVGSKTAVFPAARDLATSRTASSRSRCRSPRSTRACSRASRSPGRSSNASAGRCWRAR